MNPLRVALLAVALWICLLAVILVCSGCGAIPRIKIPATKNLPAIDVAAPRDAGKPATVASSGKESRLDPPQGSIVTITRTESQPATENAPARPAIEVREIRLAADASLIERAQHVDASTGTIDTTVAKHRINAAESRWLLIAAIITLVAGLIVRSLVPQWPGLSNGLFVAAPIFFAAWKFSEVPAWAGFVVVGVVALGALYYKRGEIDR